MYHTTSAALNALSKFNRAHFKCSHLPDILQEELKARNGKLCNIEINKDKSIDDLFPEVPASCYFDIFNSIDPKAYGGKIILFLSMINNGGPMKNENRFKI